jgi:hypothetical protein
MEEKIPQRPESYLDEETFAELEKAGNVNLAPAQRDELNAAISTCISIKDWNEAYSHTAIEARDRVAKRGSKFKEALAALDESTCLSVILGDDEGELHFKAPEASKADPGKFIEWLDAAIARAELSAPEGYTRRNGRPKETHLDRLCALTAKIYQRACGTAAIVGDQRAPFARFIHCLNDHIPREYRAASGNALVKRAQDVLTLLKTQSERAARPQFYGPLKSP